jgi:hypothetical protein
MKLGGKQMANVIKRIARYLSVLPVEIIRKNRILTKIHEMIAGMSFSGSVEVFAPRIRTNVKNAIGRESKTALPPRVFRDSICMS